MLPVSLRSGIGGNTHGGDDFTARGFSWQPKLFRSTAAGSADADTKPAGRDVVAPPGCHTALSLKTTDFALGIFGMSLPPFQIMELRKNAVVDDSCLRSSGYIWYLPPLANTLRSTRFDAESRASIHPPSWQFDTRLFETEIKELPESKYTPQPP